MWVLERSVGMELPARRTVPLGKPAKVLSRT
jgi:hypothetical protein